MKIEKLLRLVLIALLIGAAMNKTNAQAPERMSYQAVIRNNGNQPVVNQSVGMRISILQYSVSGSDVYVETHNTTTNTNGLITIEIGGGTVVSGSFNSINWSQGPFFIKSETDPSGGTNYTISGVSQLLSVPYSFHSTYAVKSTISDTSNYARAAATSEAAVHALVADSIAGGYQEYQNLTDVLDVNNDAGGNIIKNIGDPVDDGDAVNRGYLENQIQIRLSANGDTLFLGPTQFVVLKVTPYTGGQVTDPDGNVYATKVFGSQEWMIENLRTTKYADGSTIPNITNNSQWSSTITGAWSYYNNNSAYDNPHGKLYNWYTVADSRNVCPSGWHVPNEAEWNTLLRFLVPNVDTTVLDSQNPVVGGYMKHAGTSIWNSPNTGATNSSGFTAIPGGYRNVDGTFNALKDYVSYWSTGTNGSNALFRNMHRNYADLMRNSGTKGHGLSIRCLKD